MHVSGLELVCKELDSKGFGFAGLPVLQNYLACCEAKAAWAVSSDGRLRLCWWG